MATVSHRQGVLSTGFLSHVLPWHEPTAAKDSCHEARRTFQKTLGFRHHANILVVPEGCRDKSVEVLGNRRCLQQRFRARREVPRAQRGPDAVLLGEREDSQPARRARARGPHVGSRFRGETEPVAPGLRPPRRAARRAWRRSKPRPARRKARAAMGLPSRDRVGRQTRAGASGVVLAESGADPSRRLGYRGRKAVRAVAPLAPVGPDLSSGESPLGTPPPRPGAVACARPGRPCVRAPCPHPHMAVFPPRTGAHRRRARGSPARRPGLSTRGQERGLGRPRWGARLCWHTDPADELAR